MEGEEDTKGRTHVVENGFATESSADSEKGGTEWDRRDMERVGKNQELRRNFRFSSILGFTVVAMSTWEAVFTLGLYPLINGGLAAMVWMYLIALTGFGTAVWSMAEMASMAPTAGGQYHWVSEFAPRKYQKFLSYLTGWLAVLGWACNSSSMGYIVATQLKGLVILNVDNYVPQKWHVTLMIIACVTCFILFNTFFAKQLPFIENIILTVHVLGFFAVLIPLWVYSPKAPAKAVFTEFTNNGGWSSMGLACLVGFIGPVYALGGPDSGVHMAEEVKDASRVIPLSMMGTMFINGITGFVMIITFAFCLGDVQEILATPTGYPYIQVFYNSCGHVGATFMAAIIILLAFCSGIASVASASRQLFSFARDRGLPFADFLSTVRPGWDIPLNAVSVTFIIGVLLSLINLGSSIAFNAVVSLSVGAVMSTYLISISCICWKRFVDEPLPPRRWSLGKWGAPLNVCAVIFLVIVLLFAFFPLQTPVTLETMNWASVMYVAVLVWSVVYYHLYGKYSYEGPVVMVRHT